VEIVRGAYWALRLACHRHSLVLPDGYAIAQAWWPDAEQLAEAMGVPGRVTVERFERGARVWAVWLWNGEGDQDQLAAWLWVSTGRQHDQPIRRELRLAPDEAYGWSGGVAPAHCGRGLFAGLLEHVGAELLSEGRAVMWNGVHDHDLASRRAHLRAGFRPILRVTARLLGEGSCLRTRPADYADPELLHRARRLLGAASPVAVRPW